MINRVIYSTLIEKIGKGKSIILIGPRQVGKTTLIKSILEGQDYLFLDGDDPTTRNLLTSPNTEELKSILGNYKLVFIDEAQRIEGIGVTLKIITDQFKSVQLFVSGSSAFELNNQTSEPLTGRKWEYKLYPISWEELENSLGYVKAEQQLELRLLYGMYPDVINNLGDEVEVLNQLVNSYLYKDILAFGGIRKPDILEKLLRALALQLGSEVSYNELSRLIGVNKGTIESYIDLLCKGYVIFKLSSFSRNLRNEIRTNQKIYFYDTGVRNALIGNFSALDSRADTGAIWENFLISERLKNLSYSKPIVSQYFWRTKQQQEIDYVEESSGKIVGYEFKWNPKAKIKIHKSFVEAYDSEIKVINRSNFRELIV
tara:strand:- start:2554 stop:3669 length:1116 start_codon:yes stop_codon:yes gene_type:complete